jgi:hypothetical protein
MAEELNKQTEQYQYVSSNNEQLIIDKPSEPLAIIINEIPEGLTDGKLIYACQNGKDALLIFHNKSINDVCLAWNYYHGGKGGTILSYNIKYDSFEVGTYIYNIDNISNGQYWFQHDNSNSDKYFRNLKEVSIVAINNGHIINIITCAFVVPTTVAPTTVAPTTVAPTTVAPIIITPNIITAKTILPKYIQHPVIKSNKELYISYIKELKNFSLSVNDKIIYDSSIDKSEESPVKFENDYFILYGRKYSYNGLKIQKIN